MFLPEAVLTAKVLILAHDAPFLPYEWVQELKINLMDILAAVLGPFIALILMIGVLMVKNLK